MILLDELVNLEPWNCGFDVVYASLGFHWGIAFAGSVQ